MQHDVVVVLVTAVVGVLSAPATLSSSSTDGYQPPPGIRYLVERTKFLREESQRFLGNRLVLDADERLVNARLMAWKQAEYAVPEASFLPAKSFFLARPEVEASRIFQFIQRMPKGAVLHAHDFAAANVDFIVEDVSYRADLWGRVSGDAVQGLRFSGSRPGEGWQLVSELRDKASSAEAFDERLRAALTITDKHPDTTYPDQASVWAAFDDRFNLLFGLLAYEPVFRDYYRQTLLDFYEDNVMYAEFRGVFPPVFDAEGRVLGVVEVAAIYKEVTDEFKKAHPDFLGARFIYAPSRHASTSQIQEYLVNFRRLKAIFPDFIAGFDLVAHEDEGRPLIDFVPNLLQLRQEMPDVKYFFHAGETNWEQTSTDENLVDAVLLNTTRIGHGYAIVKHPKVMEEVKARGIGIEINPISNQVLNLVRDLRNHPGAALLADDYPVVISSDDPGLWSARGLSYDFYEAFVGMAGMKADLRMLKQLAINSIKYSCMDETERQRALARLNEKWTIFIRSAVQDLRVGDLPARPPPAMPAVQQQS